MDIYWKMVTNGNYWVTMFNRPHKWTYFKKTNKKYGKPYFLKCIKMY